jgi:N-formylglutamate amidohydrolase
LGRRGEEERRRRRRRKWTPYLATVLEALALRAHFEVLRVAHHLAPGAYTRPLFSST